jgi:hypothetical protein
MSHERKISGEKIAGEKSDKGVMSHERKMSGEKIAGERSCNSITSQKRKNGRRENKHGERSSAGKRVEEKLLRKGAEKRK